MILFLWLLFGHYWLWRSRSRLFFLRNWEIIVIIIEQILLWLLFGFRLFLLLWLALRRHRHIILIIKQILLCSWFLVHFGFRLEAHISFVIIEEVLAGCRQAREWSRGEFRDKTCLLRFLLLGDFLLLFSSSSLALLSLSSLCLLSLPSLVLLTLPTLPFLSLSPFTILSDSSLILLTLSFLVLLSDPSLVLLSSGFLLY